MAKIHDDDFDLVNLPEEARDPEIKAEDFTLQQADESIHEQKFQTKPTTFLKDSFRRFRKNKSSVVAAYILGALILLSIFVPIFDTNVVSKAANIAYNNLEPKLFDSGTGFWDGCKHVENCPIDTSTGLPDPEIYYESGVTNLVISSERYTNDSNKYAKEGYLQFGYYSTHDKDEAYIESYSSIKLLTDDYFILDLNTTTLTITDFNVVDLDKLKAIEGGRLKPDEYKLPDNFDIGQISVEFVAETTEGEDSVTVIEPDVIHNIGLEGYEHNEPVVINDIITNHFNETTFTNFFFRFKVEREEGAEVENENVCSLIRSFVITPTFIGSYAFETQVTNYFTSSTNTSGISGISFTDAMKFVTRPNTVGTGAKTRNNYGFWGVFSETKLVKKIYMGRAVYGSFDYDSYYATLGPRIERVDDTKFERYKSKGWVSYDILIVKKGNKFVVDENTWNAAGGFKILNKNRSPVLEEFGIENIIVDQQQVGGENTWKVDVKVMYYKYLDDSLTEMPKFLFGTDRNGKDLFKYVFDGLKWSLLLGLATFIICFTFGLLWGSVSGYFGGAVDLVMERLTDILSGVPWIVLMTLIILKANESSFGVFLLALCMTGWIGTASTTRTQFYRFRGREYVLASRTLGASDARLITRHILPNALGTIITGAVLMIPSVIFSEATISYLGLGFKNLSSLGVILSDNQAELTNHPYQLIFPSVVIALVMISFNLFGNGLRDAINPSLKGEDE